MIDWHLRYVQQAAWTRPLRAYLFEHCRLAGAQRILEVGCGTGAILAEPLCQPFSSYGMDYNVHSLAQAQRQASRAHLACADAFALPYAPRVFDMTFCHFLLLWMADPLRALREMSRVTRPGGFVLALAEPDYLHRVDRPEPLVALGCLQTQALRNQGADPGLGLRLAELFVQAGIEIIESGPLQAQPVPSAEQQLEWAVLEHDLSGLVPAAQLEQWKFIDRQARASGQRILHVPTYFAFGRVPLSGLFSSSGGQVPGRGKAPA